MARTTTDIYNDMITRKDAEADLNGLTSASQSAIWRLLFWVQAQSINLFEQLMDALTVEIQLIADNSIAGSAAWLQNTVLLFQYDAGDPQVLQIIDGLPQYSTVNPALRIVKNASVKEGVNRIVFVKAAKDEGSGLEALSVDELAALDSYVINIGFAGIPYVVQSDSPDRCQFTASIYYKGQYVATSVKEAVIESINAYLLDLPFDGVIEFNKVIDAVQSVEGVNDIDTQNAVLKIRGFSISADDPRVITVARSQETAAGYIIEEDTAGFTFDDTLTMVLDN
jgi:hypothetical protein